MLTLATIILGLIPTVLKNIPGISATIQQIIADISASIAAILGSGAITQPSVNTILSAWAGVIAALKNDPSLPADSLAAIAQLEKIVQATLLQDAVLAKSIDWSKLQPITPMP